MNEDTHIKKSIIKALLITLFIVYFCVYHGVATGYIHQVNFHDGAFDIKSISLVYTITTMAAIISVEKRSIVLGGVAVSNVNVFVVATLVADKVQPCGVAREHQSAVTIHGAVHI